MTTTYEKIIEKLDLGKEKKLLVVHQDDIGMCHGANKAFKELSGYGFVNCGSLMVPCPWSLETLEMCKFCLLYTSPSPRDQRGSRMPSSA